MEFIKGDIVTIIGNSKKSNELPYRKFNTGTPHKLLVKHVHLPGNVVSAVTVSLKTGKQSNWYYNIPVKDIILEKDVGLNIEDCL